MGTRLARAGAVAALFVGWGTGLRSGWAQDPDWAGMAWTRHCEYQAVTATGAAAFPLDSEVRMKGVLLNRAEDMLDPAPDSDPFMGGQWQVAFQAADPGDFGGTMLWMGQNIGKPKGTHPAGSYTASEYLAEIERVSHDPASGRQFRPGDLVEIRARAPGLFYRGKMNINEAHLKASFNDFDVILLYAGEGLPEPITVSLADLKQDAAGEDFDRFRFDSTRQSGPERYQGTAVRMENVWFTSGSQWGPDGDLVITDGSLTFPVKLGRSSDFSRHAVPIGPFAITGILDQEDAVSTDGFKDGYRLYVLGYDGERFYLPGEDIAPADFDWDGDVDQVDFGHLQRCYNAAEETVVPVCGDADLNKDRKVNHDDFELFERCESGPAVRANADCLGAN